MVMMVMMENNKAGAANHLGLARMLAPPDSRTAAHSRVKPFQMSPHLFAIIKFELKIIFWSLSLAGFDGLTLLLHDCNI